MDNSEEGSYRGQNRHTSGCVDPSGCCGDSGRTSGGRLRPKNTCRLRCAPVVSLIVVIVHSFPCPFSPLGADKRTVFSHNLNDGAGPIPRTPRSTSDTTSSGDLASIRFDPLTADLGSVGLATRSWMEAAIMDDRVQQHYCGEPSFQNTMARLIPGGSLRRPVRAFRGVKNTSEHTHRHTRENTHLRP